MIGVGQCISGDCENGQGTYIWTNGDKYVGEWKDGKRNGQGTYTWGSGEWEGEKYVGEFKGNKQNGDGVYFDAFGKVSQGLWKDGEFIELRVLGEEIQKKIRFEQSVQEEYTQLSSHDYIAIRNFEVITNKGSSGWLYDEYYNDALKIIYRYFVDRGLKVFIENNDLFFEVDGRINSEAIKKIPLEYSDKPYLGLYYSIYLERRKGDWGDWKAHAILETAEGIIISDETTNWFATSDPAVRRMLHMLPNRYTKSQDGEKIVLDNKINNQVKEFVEQKVNEWQKKGEFEKTSEYLVRVNEKNRTAKIKELQKTAISNIKLDFLNSIDFSNIELGDYDADNETFLLKDKKLGNLVIPVPISEARELKENFSLYNFLNPECEIIDNKLRLSYVELKYGSFYTTSNSNTNSKTYTYSLTNTQDYSITEIDYEFSAIEIDDIKSSKTTKSSRISTNKLKVGESSVNINIPTNKKVKNRYALVIGNEDYQSKQRGLSSEQNVDYAVNDAKVFKEYALKTLGVKEDNMFYLKDATAIEINRKIKLVSKIIKKLGSKAELIVYYAGHGYPDETTKIPYLIPVDVPASDLSYAIKLDDFYKDLSATGAKSITVFLDACFTGGGRESGLMASRGVKVKPKEGSLSGNLVVFSASSGNQSALPYHKEGHGMFTYYLLKKLQESKGKVTMGELADYITNEVSIQSLKTNEKEQDPIVNTSSKVVNDWRNWKF
tara:strand:+ start:1263 stop:3422 length:2160 start_codon:yes stop_codon:yes gene_type:complete